MPGTFITFYVLAFDLDDRDQPVKLFEPRVAASLEDAREEARALAGRHAGAVAWKREGNPVVGEEGEHGDRFPVGNGWRLLLGSHPHRGTPGHLSNHCGYKGRTVRFWDEDGAGWQLIGGQTMPARCNNNWHLHLCRREHTGEVETAQASGHVDVRDNRVDLPLSEDGHGFQNVLSFNDIVTLVGEGFGKRHSDQSFVFDDENRTLIHGSLLRGREINSLIQI